MNNNKYYILIEKESGEEVLRENFITELMAQDQFDEIEKIRSPKTYNGLVMNLHDYFTGGCIGSVKLIVENQHGRFIRRELYRNA